GRPQAGIVGQAALLHGIGDYYLRTGLPLTEEGFLRKGRNGAGVLARNQYGKALGLLIQAPAESERDAALAELALAVVELGGANEEVQVELRIPWDLVQQKQVVPALTAMRRVGRLDALRAVARRLIERGQPDRVLALAVQVFSSPEDDKAEALAAVGLELHA